MADYEPMHCICQYVYTITSSYKTFDHNVLMCINNIKRIWVFTFLKKVHKVTSLLNVQRYTLYVYIHHYCFIRNVGDSSSHVFFSILFSV